MTATAIHSCSSSSSSLEQMLRAGSSSRDGRGGVAVPICPDHSKCCEIPNKLPTSSSSSFGCLPDNPHIDGPGTCCNDLTKYGTTACPGYYTCATTNSTSTTTTSSSSPFICILNDSLGNVMDIKPRYNLIPSPKEALGRIYGFPIQSNDKMGLGPVVAYYSNMGPILTSTSSKRRQGGMTSMDSNVNIEAAIVVVHGSGRNADEYLYSMMVASQMQSRYSCENVLVIAPMFLAPEDGVYAVPVIMEEEDWMGMMREPMVWNETFPIAHTWRYGANALAPNDKYSSYDVMDAIVEKLLVMIGGEGSKRIIVAGHSAGGQFTQRWALTSNSPVWSGGDDQEGVRPWSMQNGNVSTKRRRRREMEWNSSRLFNHTTFDLRVVVANPRSFAYLDERRWVNSTHFAIPSRDKIESCPNYNSWEWGLQPGGLEAPYKDRALELFDGDVVRLAERYSKRNVVYLAGFDDTEHLRGSCEDDGFQGATRLERSSFFYKSLEIYFDKPVHSRIVIDCVGHDHSLMFQSEEARNVMFGE